MTRLVDHVEQQSWSAGRERTWAAGVRTAGGTRRCRDMPGKGLSASAALDCGGAWPPRNPAKPPRPRKREEGWCWVGVSEEGGNAGGNKLPFCCGACGEAGAGGGGVRLPLGGAVEGRSC